MIEDSSTWVGWNPVYGVQDADQGNVISASGYVGVQISQSTGSVVAGDLIGTNVTGTVALGNDGIGVQITGGSSNTIGGSTSGMGNLISGNTGNGVEIDGGVTANVVVGDYIGVNLQGTGGLGNTGDGVLISGGAWGNTIGGLTTTPGTGAGNVISGNTNAGVEIDRLGHQRQRGGR